MGYISRIAPLNRIIQYSTIPQNDRSVYGSKKFQKHEVL